MFASATSGDRPNNSKFSKCSIGNISNVLDAIEEKKKRNCFSVSAGAFCGNKIVEAGEECDCGYDDNECNDKCCYPRVISAKDMAMNTSAQRCKRRKGAQCRYYSFANKFVNSFYGCNISFSVLVKVLVVIVILVNLYHNLNMKYANPNRIVRCHRNVMV